MVQQCKYSRNLLQYVDQNGNPNVNVVAVRLLIASTVPLTINIYDRVFHVN